jgi:hypothetical protein
VILAFTRRQIVTALLLPLFLGAALGASNGAPWQCAMQGNAKACRCPHEIAPQTDTALLTRAGCCQRAEALSASLPSPAYRQLVQMEAPLKLVVADRARPPQLHSPVLAVSASDAHALAIVPRVAAGPPLFIKHRALLI